MQRLIIVGSPRRDGRSAHLADELFNTCIADCPEDGVSIVSVASMDVQPCTGCDACRTACAEVDPTPALEEDAAPQPEEDAAPSREADEEDDSLMPCDLVLLSDAACHQCVIDDDFPEIREHLDAADALIVVSPVYFSGAPAQMKALLDRMQPYFWSDARTHVHEQGARPMILHVVGESSGPHGFDPLIGTVKAAFAVAGFKLERVYDWVGKIDDSGTIIADPVECPLPGKADETDAPVADDQGGDVRRGGEDRS